jgi:hypothetical protein
MNICPFPFLELRHVFNDLHRLHTDRGHTHQQFDHLLLVIGEARRVYGRPFPALTRLVPPPSFPGREPRLTVAGRPYEIDLVFCFVISAEVTVTLPCFASRPECSLEVTVTFLGDSSAGVVIEQLLECLAQ